MVDWMVFIQLSQWLCGGSVVGLIDGLGGEWLSGWFYEWMTVEYLIAWMVK